MRAFIACALVVGAAARAVSQESPLPVQPPVPLGMVKVPLDNVVLGPLSAYFELESAELKGQALDGEEAPYRGGPLWLRLRATRATLGADGEKIRAGFFDGENTLQGHCDIILPRFPLEQNERVKIQINVPGDTAWKSVKLRGTELQQPAAAPARLPSPIVPKAETNR